MAPAGHSWTRRTRSRCSSARSDVRILLTIHHHLEAGAGAPGITLALRDAYRDAGHVAEIRSWDDMPERGSDRVREALFPVWLAGRLAREARSFDVVDASTGDAWLWARLRHALAPRGVLVCRSHGLEHVYWERELREARASSRPIGRVTRAYHGGVRLREVAASLRGADACFLSNTGDRDRAVAQLGVAPERAQVVRNGIPAAFLGLPVEPTGGTVRLAHVGSWAERKGIRQLAPAVSAVLARRPEVSITYLGTRVAPDVVRAAHEPAARDRVAVVPSFDRAELPALLAGHAIVVTASLAEGFSLALPEAMACGLAPVATALDGAREIVADDENGVLVPVGDAGALEHALDALAGDRERLERLRRAARASAQELGWPTVAEDQLERYAALLRRRVASPPP